MAKEKKRARAPPEPVPLNEEALKGVWADGIGFWIGEDYIILEGVITKPRTEKSYIVSRIMFPTRVLETLARALTEAVKKQKEFKKRKKKSAKK